LNFKSHLWGRKVDVFRRSVSKKIQEVQ